MHAVHVVQIDEPYMQARPDEARARGQRALNRALDGVTGVTAVHNGAHSRVAARR
jgi:5-methyltetrahydropteroyltriglutamate--homocysteine methyltransferase